MIRTNMSACVQTRVCAHECGVFDTPPHFVHSQDTKVKCISHALGDNLLYLKCMAWNVAGVQGTRLHVSHMWQGVTCSC